MQRIDTKVQYTINSHKAYKLHQHHGYILASFVPRHSLLPLEHLGTRLGYICMYLIRVDSRLVPLAKLQIMQEILFYSPHHTVHVVPSHGTWRPPRLPEWDERDILPHGGGQALCHTDAALDRPASS